MLKTPRCADAFAFGVIFTLLAAISWGSMAVAAQLVMARDAINALWLVVVRLCASGALLLLWVFFTDRAALCKLVSRLDNLRDTALGAFFIAGGQFAFMQAIAYSNAGTAAVVLTTVPLWVALWEAFARRTLPTARMTVCFLLASAGVVLIVTKGDFSALEFDLRGVLWALGCAVLTAAYSIQPRALLGRVRVMPFMSCAMLLGGCMAAVVALVDGVPEIRLDLLGTALLLHIVLVGTLFAFCCYMTAVCLISPVTVGILGCAEPVTAYVLSVLFLHQQVGTFEVIGIVMVLAIVVILSGTSGRTASGENVLEKSGNR